LRTVPIHVLRVPGDLSVGEVSNALKLNVFLDTHGTGRSGSSVVANGGAYDRHAD